MIPARGGSGAGRRTGPSTAARFRGGRRAGAWPTWLALLAILLVPFEAAWAADASPGPTAEPTGSAEPSPSPSPARTPASTPRPPATPEPSATPGPPGSAAPSAPPSTSIEPSIVDGSPAPDAEIDPSTASTAPDIVVVMVDDLGYIPDDRVLARLPNIRDVWLEGGLRFRHMYDETPLCCPSRASFLTGQHTWRHGVTRNDGTALDPTNTIAVALDDAGYHTIMAGNYLNKVRGSRVPPGWDRTFIKRYNMPPTFWRNGNPVRFRGRFVDDVMRQQAVRWVRNAPADQPLFAWVAPVAPHVCEFRQSQCFAPAVFRPDRGARDCRGIPDLRPPSYTAVTNPLEARPMPRWPEGWQLRRVCQSLRVVDRMVGQLVTVLARRERPAILVFTSDNGMSWGQHGFTFKQTPPATRVPFYVAGTGIEPAAIDALVSKIDIAPTLADLAGATFAHADGVSFAALLRDRPFFGRPEHLEVMPRGVASGYPGWDALRTPRWHFIRWQTGRRELYDLEADPWELDNRVREEASLAAMLEARLNELVAASGGIPPAVPPVGPTDQCGTRTSRRPAAC